MATWVEAPVVWRAVLEEWLHRAAAVLEEWLRRAAAAPAERVGWAAAHRAAAVLAERVRRAAAYRAAVVLAERVRRAVAERAVASANALATRTAANPTRRIACFPRERACNAWTPEIVP